MPSLSLWLPRCGMEINAGRSILSECGQRSLYYVKYLQSLSWPIRFPEPPRVLRGTHERVIISPSGSRSAVLQDQTAIRQTLGIRNAGVMAIKRSNTFGETTRKHKHSWCRRVGRSHRVGCSHGIAPTEPNGWSRSWMRLRSKLAPGTSSPA